MGLDQDRLNGKHELAIDLLMCGMNDGDIAARVGSACRRSTPGATTTRVSARCLPSVLEKIPYNSHPENYRSVSMRTKILAPSFHQLLKIPLSIYKWGN